MTAVLKSPKEKPTPLEGIRIVGFGTFIAGPGAGSILGELGADVLKIESLKGDPLRKEVLRFGKTPLALKGRVTARK